MAGITIDIGSWPKGTGREDIPRWSQKQLLTAYRTKFAWDAVPHDVARKAGAIHVCKALSDSCRQKNEKLLIRVVASISKGAHHTPPRLTAFCMELEGPAVVAEQGCASQLVTDYRSQTWCSIARTEDLSLSLSLFGLSCTSVLHSIPAFIADGTD